MAEVRLIGVPYDLGCREETSVAVDSRNGPAAMRAAYTALNEGYGIETPFVDTGDLVLEEESVKELLTEVMRSLRSADGEEVLSIFFGGAHTLTLGALRAFGGKSDNYSLIYIDAHPDMMPRDKVDYGSTLYHAVEEGSVNAERIALIGVRQIEDAEQEFIDEHGIYLCDAVEAAQFGLANMIMEVKSQMPPPYYVSVDLDAIDPHLAPGVSAPYPLGFTPTEVSAIARSFVGEECLGLDIVELSPSRDKDDRTAKIAASLLYDLALTLAES